MMKFSDYLRSEARRWGGDSEMPSFRSVLVVLLVLLFIAFLIFLIPDEKDYRDGLLTFGGAVGVLVAWLGYLRGVVNAKQLKLAEDQRLDDRLSRTVDQLGSSSVALNGVSLRLLARIAENNKQDKEILNVIIRAVQGFVYEKSPKAPTEKSIERRKRRDIELANMHGSVNEQATRRAAAIEQAESKLRAEAEDYFRPNEDTVPMAIKMLEIFLIDRSYGDAFATWRPLKLTGRYLANIRWGVGKDELRLWAGAQLFNSDFSEGQMLYVDLRHADLSRSNLTMVQFLERPPTEMSLMRRADFTGANFLGAAYYKSHDDWVNDTNEKTNKRATFVSKEWLLKQGVLESKLGSVQNLLKSEDSNQKLRKWIADERGKKNLNLDSVYTEEEFKSFFAAFPKS